MPEKRKKAKARENEGLPAFLYPVPHYQELVTLRDEFATSTVLKIIAPLYWTNLFPFSHVTWGASFMLVVIHSLGLSQNGPVEWDFQSTVDSALTKFMMKPPLLSIDIGV